MVAVRNAKTIASEIKSAFTAKASAEPAKAACAMEKAIVVNFSLLHITPIDPHKPPAKTPLTRELMRSVDIL